MAEKIKLTISPAVAAFVRPGTTHDVKLAAFDAAVTMTIADRLMLLFCLSKDAEPSIRSSAILCLQQLPEAVISEYINSANAHPLINEVLTRYHSNQTKHESPAIPEKNDTKEAAAGTIQDTLPAPVEEDPVDEDPVDEADEEFLSKYKTAQIMGIGEKIKMALSGDKEWRAILVKDSNKLVSGSVIKNPRITDGEILTLVKSGIQNDEIMRLICANKEWIKDLRIRKALIENNRTPVQNAIRYLGTMGEKDLAFFAKSKNISSVISTMAKRLLLNKKK